MIFLLDENVTSSILKFLRMRKLDVLTLKELNKQGTLNGQVAKLAIENQAIIITFDADYLNLKKSMQEKLRVIYIHMHRMNPSLARNLLEKHLDFCLLNLKQP